MESSSYPQAPFLILFFEWLKLCEADDLRAKKNQVSKQIGALMAQGKKEEAEAVKAEVAQISKRLTELEPLEKEYQEQQAHQTSRSPR